MGCVFRLEPADVLELIAVAVDQGALQKALKRGNVLSVSQFDAPALLGIAKRCA